MTGRSGETNRDPVDADYNALSLQGPLDLNDVTRTSLTGTTLTTGAAMIQNLTPTTTTTVKLPAEQSGLYYFIANRTDGTSSVKVKDDAGSTLTTLTANEVAECLSDGTGWIVQTGAGDVS
ncbi:MAG: hypothetical protein SVU88_02280 [Candidatus Nanohaloarchaea archaeon]|nr:hypothetical protein [Candidatus Nanohaloarchaea archaeon]